MILFGFCFNSINGSFDVRTQGGKSAKFEANVRVVAAAAYFVPCYFKAVFGNERLKDRRVAMMPTSGGEAWGENRSKGSTADKWNDK